jgi:hypothetical protein
MSHYFLCWLLFWFFLQFLCEYNLCHEISYFFTLQWHKGFNSNYCSGGRCFKFTPLLNVFMAVQCIGRVKYPQFLLFIFIISTCLCLSYSNLVWSWFSTIILCHQSVFECRLHCLCQWMLKYLKEIIFMSFPL